MEGEDTALPRQSHALPDHLGINPEEKDQAKRVGVVAGARDRDKEEQYNPVTSKCRETETTSQLAGIICAFQQLRKEKFITYFPA